MQFKRFIAFAAVVAAMVPAGATDTTEKSGAAKFLPEVHGVVRARWEGEWATQSAGGFGSRFQVRNARVNVGGQIFSDIRYFVQIDACDQGKMKFLDAWGRWTFYRGVSVQAGQFRVPFGVDCFRAPGTYIFANRSFIAKNMVNMRQVGVKLSFAGIGYHVPIDVEAGVFNTASTGNHDVWQRAYTYAAKAIAHIGYFNLSGSFVSYCPADTRVNVADAALTWQVGPVVAEAEYQYKYYARSAFRHVNAWNAFVSYSMPLRHRPGTLLSFQGRFDGMEKHSSGVPNSEGLLVADLQTRTRATLGATIAKIKGSTKAALSVNYEKFFYPGDISVPRGASDKLVAEVVVKF